MIEFLIAAIAFAAMALLLFYRLVDGPTVADRIVAGDAIDLLIAASLVCYSLYSGRGVYLDVALVVAVLGFIGTLMLTKYLEGSL